MMERVDVVAMRPYGNSGSRFLHGLFDQCDAIAILPMFVDAYEFCSKEKGALTPEEYLELFEKNNCGLFDLREGYFCANLPEDSDQNLKNIDRTRFCSTFSDLCHIYGDCGRREFFLLLHLALHLTRGRSMDTLTLILVHLHAFVALIHRRADQRRGKLSTKGLTIFFEDFPRAKFIATMRDPLCYYETSVFLSEERSEKFLRDYVFGSVWVWSLFYDRWTPEREIFLLKITDLHRHFDQVMKALSLFLGVPHDPSIREATILGNRTVNVSKKQKSTANTVNPNFVDWKGGVISEYQISIIRFFFRDIIQTFFPENVKSLRLIDYLRVGKFWLFSPLFLFNTLSPRAFYYDTWQKVKGFVRGYPKVKKFHSLGIERAKTYES
ncbi:MAG: sulfotransferase [Holosporales bacterium]|nr:sulfotransferase [Holosporales bacterium]